MSAKMKGLCKLAKGPGLTEVVDIDVPELPADDWVLIKIKAAGLCATDRPSCWATSSPARSSRWAAA